MQDDIQNNEPLESEIVPDEGLGDNQLSVNNGSEMNNDSEVGRLTSTPFKEYQTFESEAGQVFFPILKRKASLDSVLSSLKSPPPLKR